MSPFLSALLQTGVQVGVAQEKRAGKPGAEKHEAAVKIAAEAVNQELDLFDGENTEVKAAVDDMIRAFVRLQKALGEM